MDLISHQVFNCRFYKSIGEILVVKILRSHMLMVSLVLITEFDWLAGWTQEMVQWLCIQESSPQI